MADGYDLQGKPLRTGVLVGFYFAPVERIVAGRVLRMNNGKWRVNLQMGAVRARLLDVPAQQLVVLEEPVWPNK